MNTAGFETPEVELTRVDPSFRTLWWVRGTLLWLSLAVVAAAVPLTVAHREDVDVHLSSFIPSVVLAGLWVFNFWRGYILTKYLGYAMGARTFYVARGALFRQLTEVPYARLQFVEVSAGPLHQMFGLVTLQLHTASNDTQAVVPGLRPEVADQLRRDLSEVSRSNLAGL